MSTEELVKAAKEYTVKGWVVHPLSKPDDKGNSPGKKPLLGNWQELTHTPDDICSYIANKGCNIGLVCGKASGLTIIDLDSELFMDALFNGFESEFEIDTLKSRRTEGRGHIYFEYNPDLPASKHHDLGIEILSDGNNAVLPPSVHNSGDIYRWDTPDTPIIPMPKALEENLKKLFETEIELKGLIGKCRHCFRDILKRKPDMHGAEGREYMIAVCTDLKANGAKEGHIKMFARLMYAKDYNEFETLKEWEQIDPAKTWTCDTLKVKLPAYIDLSKCEKCEERRQKYKEFKEGKKTKEPKPITLPPIPQEAISSEPITVQDLLKIYKKYLYVEEDESITIPISEVISNFAPIEPDIMGIIGASGSSKTEVIRALGELENQYIYPVSSITGHTLVSGFEDNVDLAPSLRGRLLTIKDFTTLLAKKKDEVSEIFADLRELTDGHIGKDFGSGVKKHYTGIHTSILFGCTNAIEKYNSMFSLLGQRILFFRPRSDKKKAMYQAMKNAGKESAFRDELHKTTMQFINHILHTKKERLTDLSHISEEYGEIIGELVYFLAIVRTHIDRDFKGEMATLPEPEYPTRLAKTMCKLVDAHAVIHDREPTEDDLRIAYRLVLDNIPTDRLRILNTLLDGEARTTTEVQEAARVSNAFARRILEDLKALEVIECFHAGQGKPDVWQFSNEEYRKILTQIQDFSKHEKIKLSPDNEQVRGAIRLPCDTDTITKVLHKIKTNNKEEESQTKESGHLSELHPGLNRDAEPHREKHDGEKDPFLKEKIKRYITQSYNNGNRPSEEGWKLILSQVMADHNLTMATAVEYVKVVRSELGVGW